ncbi:MAG: radical SAM family protein [Parcubacteria bacterium 33_209]|nr:MAG: radical SAM family protein [Parcubacteria bacterium 33_209]
MTKDVFFKIKNNINWRKESGFFMLLDPVDYRLYFFNKDVSRSVLSKGIIIQTKGNVELIRYLKNKKVIQKINNTKITMDSEEKDFLFPLNVTIQVTDNCNLKCIYCHRNSKNTKTISFSNFKKIIKELRTLNVFNINISGGEPLLLPEISEMVKIINDSGMKATMSSNCTLLTDDLARKLKIAGLRQMQVSIDSDNFKTHDRLRGVNNVFYKTINNILSLKKEGIPFAVVTTLVNQTPEEYEKVIDMAYKIGAFAHKTNTFISSSNSSIKNSPNSNNFRSVKKFIKVWKRKKDEYDGRMILSAETMFSIQMGKNYISPFDIPSILDCGCPAGFLTCAINQKGDVLPCSFFSSGLILGNIFEDSFENIWNSKVAKEFRNRDNISVCGDCEYKLSCGGCRARSFGEFNKIKERDPYCFKNL